MKLQINYVTNEKGNTTAVLIPIKDWKQHQKKFLEYEKLAKFKLGIKDAFREIEEIKKGNKKGVTLKEFLDEL